MINGVRNRRSDARDPNLSHPSRADWIECEIGFANERDIDIRHIGIRRDVVVGEIPNHRQSRRRVVGSLFR